LVSAVTLANSRASNTFGERANPHRRSSAPIEYWAIRSLSNEFGFRWNAPYTRWIATIDLPGMIPNLRTTDQLAWAIVGAGRVAHTYAGRLSQRPDVNIVGVHSRTMASASSLAAAVDSVTLTSLDEVAACRPDVVYVATPHSFHAAAVRAVLTAGCVVLCEKPLTTSAAETAELQRLAASRGAVLIEAMPFRFHPLTDAITNLVQTGALGSDLRLEAEFGFAADLEDPRLFNPALGGGVLLDVGCYPLSLAVMVAMGAGIDIDEGRAGALAVKSDWGAYPVEIEANACWTLPGFVTEFTASFRRQADNTARLVGRRGIASISRPWGPGPDATITVAVNNRREVMNAVGPDSFDCVINAACAAARGAAIDANPAEQVLATAALLDRCRSAASRYRGGAAPRARP
jgi:predicted dehydrogenase